VLSTKLTTVDAPWLDNNFYYTPVERNALQSTLLLRLGVVWKSHSIPISTKIRLMKALVWPVAITYGCESWTPRKNEERRLDAIEMKGLRKIPRVSWTAKKTNEWFLTKLE